MDKLLEFFVKQLADIGGAGPLFLVAACVVGLYAWHQHLQLIRLRESLEKETKLARQLAEDLTALKSRAAEGRNPTDRRSDDRRAPSRVLVIEDNATMQLIIEQMLRTCLVEPEVRVRASASEAVETIRRFHPDLLILDLNLPGGNGLELLKYLRGAQSDLPVLVYSGYEDQLELLSALRRQGGLENMTVLRKGSDASAFVGLVPTLFKRRASDHAQTAEAQASKRDRRIGARNRRRALPLVQAAEAPSARTPALAESAAS
jgi:CheY-like chemotaxis protein